MRGSSSTVNWPQPSSGWRLFFLRIRLRPKGRDEELHSRKNHDRSEEQKKARTIEKQIELDAPANKIWQMLTDSEELARWFPLEACVEPGKGGKISLSWGPEYEGAAAIEVWEPGQCL